MFELIGLGFLQIFLLLTGSALGAVCVIAVSLYTRGLSNGKRRARKIAFAFPLIALFYLEAGFFLHALVRDASGEDNFLNGFYHYPLGNGYQLVIFDKDPESGDIEHPESVIVVNDARAVQAAGHLVFVSRYERQNATDFSPNAPSNRYSVIDTDTSQVTDYPSRDALNSIAADQGISLTLLPTEKAFLRATSAAGPGRVALTILLMPLIIASILLLVRLRRLRRASI